MTIAITITTTITITITITVVAKGSSGCEVQDYIDSL
jgi:hypothetical protein